MGKEKKEKKTKNVKKGKQFSFKKIYTPETISTYFELRQRNQENNNRCKQEINQLEEECLGSPQKYLFQNHLSVQTQYLVLFQVFKK